MKALPAICSDVDGVLLRGKKIIGRSDLTLRHILQPLSSLFPSHFPRDSFCRAQLPFLCLTNGGGQLESDKARKMNTYLQLGQENFYSLKGENIILNFTPLRPLFRTEFSDKNVMLLGSGKIRKIAEDSGLRRYITFDEFSTLYPERFPLYQRERLDPQQTRQAVMKRFGLAHEALLKHPLQMSAIFILHDPVYWEECFQIVLDYCSSEDGRPLQGDFRKPQSQKHIPIYTVNNDITYADEFELPRFAYGPFTHCLRAIFKEQLGYAPQIIEYGKPTLNTSRYAGTRSHHFSALSSRSEGPAPSRPSASPSSLLQPGAFCSSLLLTRAGNRNRGLPQAEEPVPD